MLAGKSRAIKVASADFLPFPSSARPGPAGQGRGRNICTANTSFAAKKKCLMGGVTGSAVQGRTSQGLLQQQLGSQRAET